MSNVGYFILGRTNGYDLAHPKEKNIEVFSSEKYDKVQEVLETYKKFPSFSHLYTFKIEHEWDHVRTPGVLALDSAVRNFFPEYDNDWGIDENPTPTVPEGLISLELIYTNHSLEPKFDLWEASGGEPSEEEYEPLDEGFAFVASGYGSETDDSV